MKKTGILHPGLNKLISETGHLDEIVITDAGVPLPEEVNTRIDLALKEGTVPFLEVLNTVIDELFVEKVIMAEEIKTDSPKLHKQLLIIFKDVNIEYISHIAFKESTTQSSDI